MPFVSLPKLERSPLQLVLVQVRFAPVKMMRSFVPELQDHFRRTGYPRFDEEQTQTFTLLPAMKAETSTRWSFFDREKREGIVLTDDFIIFETNQYQRFDVFVSQFLAVLNRLNDQAQIDYATQIGLRYVNLIQSLDGKMPEWFVREQFQGINEPEKSAYEVKNQFVVQIKTKEDTILTLRSFEGIGVDFLPPDLGDTRLKFDVDLFQESEFRILDYDHIWKGEMDFKTDEVAEKMRKLHFLIEQTFQKTVTKEAIEVWKKPKDNP